MGVGFGHHVYANAHQAIRDGNGAGRPVGVAYRRPVGWVLFELTQGTSDQPEFICMGSGRLPVPLSDWAEGILSQIFAKALNS